MTSQDQSKKDATDVSKLLDNFDQESIPTHRPEWLAIGSRMVRSALKPFMGTTFEEMADFVLGDTGITVEAFDAGSPKTLHRLFEELAREVNLALDLQSGQTRKIVRFSSNAVGMVFDSRTWLALHEVGRTVLESGSVIMHPEPKPHGCRETALRQKRIREGVFVEEPPLVTMQRGFLEEPGIGIPSELLMTLAPKPVVSEHESTVYRCDLRNEDGSLKLFVTSIVSSWQFGFNIAAGGLSSLDDWPAVCENVKRDGDLLLVEDEGVLLMFQALPLSDSWVELLKKRIAEHASL